MIFLYDFSVKETKTCTGLLTFEPLVQTHVRPIIGYFWINTYKLFNLFYNVNKLPKII